MQSVCPIHVDEKRLVSSKRNSKDSEKKTEQNEQHTDHFATYSKSFTITEGKKVKSVLRMLLEKRSWGQ